MADVRGLTSLLAKKVFLRRALVHVAREKGSRDRDPCIEDRTDPRNWRASGHVNNYLLRPDEFSQSVISL